MKSAFQYWIAKQWLGLQALSKQFFERFSLQEIHRRCIMKLSCDRNDKQERQMTAGNFPLEFTRFRDLRNSLVVPKPQPLLRKCDCRNAKYVLFAVYSLQNRRFAYQIDIKLIYTNVCSNDVDDIH